VEEKKMNAVSRIVALVPDRVARTQTGTLFNPGTPGVCSHPERVAHLARFLDWLGPLREVTRDDLQVFGLLTPYAKPAMEEEGEVDTEHAAAPLAPLAPAEQATPGAPAADPASSAAPAVPAARSPFEDAFH
jgi:hypothetical protein